MKKGLLIFTSIFINLWTVFGQGSYLDKGNSFLNAGNLNGVENVFREGIKAEPNDLILQCQLGLTLIQKERYEDAELILKKVLEIEPDNIGASWYSGNGDFKNSKDRKAIEHFERVLPLLDKSSGQYSQPTGL